jgi:hypothetical protein
LLLLLLQPEPTMISAVIAASASGCGGSSCITCCECYWQCFNRLIESGTTTSQNGACFDCHTECGYMASDAGCSSSSVMAAGECSK